MSGDDWRNDTRYITGTSDTMIIVLVLYTMIIVLVLYSTSTCTIVEFGPTVDTPLARDVPSSALGAH